MANPSVNTDIGREVGGVGLADLAGGQSITTTVVSTKRGLDVNILAGGSGGSPTVNITPVETNPSVPNSASTQILAANASRKYLFIQNNSSVNWMISLSGNALTGIVPSGSNHGILLIAGQAYESPGSGVPITAITAYQSSGGTLTSLTVVEG